MARIIVTTESTEGRETPVLLDESVCSVQISTRQAAAQLLERVTWAIADAEDQEQLPDHLVPR
jgi:hypothetical protein